MGFFGSPGSKNSRIEKISMWEILFIFGLFEDQKRKKIYYHNMVRRAIFCYPSKLPYFDQKGVPLPPRGGEDEKSFPPAK